MTLPSRAAVGAEHWVWCIFLWVRNGKESIVHPLTNVAVLLGDTERELQRLMNECGTVKETKPESECSREYSNGGNEGLERNVL